MITIKLEGYEQVKEMLQDFPKATERNIIRRALMKAGEPILNDAKAHAPVLSGKLQASFAEGTKLSRWQRKLHRKVNEVEIFVGAGALVQAITQEFGTINHPPHPFMRPAWDANSGRALTIFRNELTVEIDKAAARAARKAARIAAKMK